MYLETRVRGKAKDRPFRPRGLPCGVLDPNFPSRGIHDASLLHQLYNETLSQNMTRTFVVQDNWI